MKKIIIDIDYEPQERDIVEAFRDYLKGKYSDYDTTFTNNLDIIDFKHYYGFDKNGFFDSLLKKEVNDHNLMVMQIGFQQYLLEEIFNEENNN